jgi:hypothetical protein
LQKKNPGNSLDLQRKVTTKSPKFIEPKVRFPFFSATCGGDLSPPLTPAERGFKPVAGFNKSLEFPSAIKTQRGSHLS